MISDSNRAIISESLIMKGVSEEKVDSVIIIIEETCEKFEFYHKFRNKSHPTIKSQGKMISELEEDALALLYKIDRMIYNHVKADHDPAPNVVPTLHQLMAGLNSIGQYFHLGYELSELLRRDPSVFVDKPGRFGIGSYAQTSILNEILNIWVDYTSDLKMSTDTNGKRGGPLIRFMTASLEDIYEKVGIATPSENGLYQFVRSRAKNYNL